MIIKNYHRMVYFYWLYIVVLYVVNNYNLLLFKNILQLFYSFLNIFYNIIQEAKFAKV